MKLEYKNLQQEFFLIAGPCVLEDESTVMKTAEFLQQESQKHDFQFIFKSSYEKANRTSAKSYRGPGLEKGLQLLAKVKKEFDLPILTDIHLPQQAKQAAEVADILQIPAFLSRQTALLQAAAVTARIVNIKKGQFMAPEDMLPAAQKVTAAGNPKVLLTERGSCFGYHNLVVDFRSFAIMSSFGFPVVYDVTHSLQQPSAGQTSGGTPQFAQMMATAAVATGKVQGLFLETHPNPSKALSDAASMLPLNEVPELLNQIDKILKMR